jgi:hypothetical protein
MVIFFLDLHYFFRDKVASIITAVDSSSVIVVAVMVSRITYLVSHKFLDWRLSILLLSSSSVDADV